MPKTRKIRKNNLHPQCFLFHCTTFATSLIRFHQAFFYLSQQHILYFFLVSFICIRQTGLKLSGVSINREKKIVNNIPSNPGLTDKLKAPHSRNSMCLTYSVELDMKSSSLAPVSWPLCVPALFSQVSSASADVHHYDQNN